MADTAKPDKPANETFWRLNNPISYGVGISAILIGAYLMLGFQTKCIANVCETNFQRFFEADPNEIGDTLAGLFAALAFVWIIVTVFLQSHELREQRKELHEQRRASEEMARAMSIQAEIYEDEKRERNETFARVQAEQLYSVLKDRILAVFSKHPIVYFSDGGSVEFRILDLIEKNYSSGAAIKAQDALTLLQHVVEALKNTMKVQQGIAPKLRSAEVLSVQECLDELNKNLMRAGKATQMKFSYPELLAANATLDNLLESR